MGKRWLSVLLVFCLAVPTFAFAASDVTVTVTELSGNVFVKKSGGQREFPAFVDMKLSKGDWIRTEDDSSVTIEFEDGNETVFGSNSKVMISELSSEEEEKKTGLKLWNGHAWNRVGNLLNANDTYEVETPTTVMGVRGTLFLVTVDGIYEVENVRVLDGAVGVEDRESASQNDENQDEVIVVLDQEFTKDQQKESLDEERLIEEVDEVLLANIIEDLVDESDKVNQEVDQLTQDSEQIKEREALERAISLAKKATKLSELAKTIVEKTKQSDKSEKVEEILQGKGKDLDLFDQQSEENVEKSKRNEAQLTEKAKEEFGLKDEEIEQIPIIPGINESNDEQDQTANEDSGDSDSSSGGSGDSDSTPPSVWLENNEQTIVVKASDFDEEIYGIQVHIGLNLDQVSGTPVNEGNLLFPNDYNEANYLHVNDFPGGADELIFVQSLFSQPNGLSFTGEKTIAEITLPFVTTDIDVQLLDVQIVDPDGNVIADVEWDTESITIPLTPAT